MQKKRKLETSKKLVLKAISAIWPANQMKLYMFGHTMLDSPFILIIKIFTDTADCCLQSLNPLLSITCLCILAVVSELGTNFFFQYKHDKSAANSLPKPGCAYQLDPMTFDFSRLSNLDTLI